MIKRIALAVLCVFLGALLQSTVLFSIRLNITLAVVLFTSYYNGAVSGVLTGFLSGILVDFLSPAPLGFNALMLTVIGMGVGSLKGKIFIDTLLFPVFLGFIAVLFKAFFFLIMHYYAPLIIPSYTASEFPLWIECIVTALGTPIIFVLLNHFKAFFVEPR
ncbi:MAG: rod shape-determining protein MreD [Treponema sp.]|jgi:rod shape-determining protein MreD|nr:rod shape-determining protein MreD [Treponema sp.]